MKRTIKMFSILLILFLLSGCTVEYNLNFADDKLEEQINVSLIGNDYRKDYIESLSSQKLLAISQGLEQKEYKSKFNDTGKEFTANYSYTYEIDDFNKNNVISRCYDSFALTSTNDYYLLSTGKIFKCMSVVDYKIIDSYKISITTNYKVLSSNADEVKDNTYIWYINNKNNETTVSKPITIKFSKEKVEESAVKNLSMMIISLLIVVLVGGILLFAVNVKKKENNKI